MAETTFPRKAKTAISLLLIIGALAFYWGWGVAYNSWNLWESDNMGVYAIFTTLFALGVLGLLLSRRQ